MICYKDTTFCASPHCKNDCGRQLTKKIQEDADHWWGKGEGQAPIAVAYFCGEPEKRTDEKETISN